MTTVALVLLLVAVSLERCGGFGVDAFTRTPCGQPRSSSWTSLKGMEGRTGPGSTETEETAKTEKGRNLKKAGDPKGLPKPFPVSADFYEMNPFEKLALGLFRTEVQRGTEWSASPAFGLSGDESFDGLVKEAKHYVLESRKSGEEQQTMVLGVLSRLAGPFFPQIYRTLMAPFPWAPLLTSLLTPLLLSFLVGPTRWSLREDEQLGGCYVERCRFLAETGCKGLCVNMCKRPTERFFADTMGLPLTMRPDFETCECTLSFGLVPEPLEEDETVPSGCLGGCTMAGGLAEKGLVSACSCAKSVEGKRLASKDGARKELERPAFDTSQVAV
uniref:Beta-carotene isomerase D27-like C-terminal domain-containing protein n=1 Tax=Chromera velia CCMP2878 TaxID=1169474 RepID=A0A0K6S9P8_9ALVE|eukprot:Cvel_8162.t1-p1 / transcript=Cvel_8162.t1 / gene=Cvel_8162 / organism=Chromera_velia_CCMP2878 / gene_product=Beta-carotene isomerase D27, chloroplastic, putative / transcript_product=Beta-carotene isomerase D27, chloroplastic, putative / location=Cvel_scaffold444:68530-71717(-) / protein_length=329 / sequence_SO=supercontig / SO=protein_coding / is_pseudo=false